MVSRNLRARLAADPQLGAGNVLVKLAEHGADPRGPGLTFDVDVDGHPAWTPLTLGQLTERVAVRAAWLRRAGIGARDPVAVYVTSSADVFLTYFALTWLGAIPALMNGNMPVEIAADFIRRLGAVGVVTDADHRAVSDHGPGVPILADAGELSDGDPNEAPAHYRHHPDDPVAITHSSGTTRTPAAVVHSHGSLFAAVRAVRLTEPRPSGEVRELSALPAAHAAGVITVNQALCNRYQLLYLTAQGGPFPLSGSVVLDAIERWRATGVFGFAVTWAELAKYDLSRRDLSTIRNWSNTGDCAHEAHVRRLVEVGSHQAYTRDGLVTVRGSKFIDTIGSTEMGHGAFWIAHRLGSTRYDRCVGRPYPFADVTLFDLETGAEVPDGTVGQLGLKSPTLALGYWNDSVNTFRTRFNGYYLTGDLMYRDSEGRYYHLDRISDAVDLGGGDYLYTALAEERILATCPGVRDCTVVAGRDPAGDIVTDVLLVLDPGEPDDLSRTESVRRALGDPGGTTLRQVKAVADDELVLGPTGKVRKFLMRQRHLAAEGVAPSRVAAGGVPATGSP